MADEEHDPYEDGITDERCLALRRLSGRVNDDRAVVSFLYELMRDHLPTGTVEELVRRNEMVTHQNHAQFTNGGLANYAQYLADRLNVGHPIPALHLDEIKPIAVGTPDGKLIRFAADGTAVPAWADPERSGEQPFDQPNAAAWWSEHGRLGQTWHCEAESVGMEREAGVCSPTDRRGHRYPCGWMG